MKTLLLILILCLPVSAQIGGHVELGKDLYSDMSYTDIRIDYDFTFWNVHLIPDRNSRSCRSDSVGNLGERSEPAILCCVKLRTSKERVYAMY